MKEEERRAKREKIEDGEIFRREKIIKIIFKWEQEKKKKCRMYVHVKYGT